MMKCDICCSFWGLITPQYNKQIPLWQLLLMGGLYEDDEAHHLSGWSEIFTQIQLFPGWKDNFIVEIHWSSSWQYLRVSLSVYIQTLPSLLLYAPGFYMPGKSL